MSMQNDDPLLHDVLNEGVDHAALESASLDVMICTVRRTRQRKRLARAAAVLSLAALGVAGLVHFVHSDRGAGRAQIPVISAETKRDPTPRVRKISDEELFALFPDRQMALVGPPGDQRLLFLDRPRGD